MPAILSQRRSSPVAPDRKADWEILPKILRRATTELSSMSGENERYERKIHKM